MHSVSEAKEEAAYLEVVHLEAVFLVELLAVVVDYNLVVPPLVEVDYLAHLCLHKETPEEAYSEVPHLLAALDLVLNNKCKEAHYLEEVLQVEEHYSDLVNLIQLMYTVMQKVAVMRNLRLYLRTKWIKIF